MENIFKVSVIIPVYNAAEFLRQGLDSLLKQTLRDIEIICVNDGSSDKSLEILKEYEKKDNRIKVIDQKNAHGHFENSIFQKTSHLQRVMKR